jgi:hypothetical protein
MYLHDTDTFGDKNELALAASRRMLGVLHLLGDREEAVDTNLLTIMIWAKMGNIFVREILRLEDEGDTFGMSSLVHI